MIPQLIFFALVLLSLGSSIERHGEIKEKKENAWTTIVGHGICLSLLYWGGFFDVFFK